MNQDCCLKYRIRNLLMLKASGFYLIQRKVNASENISSSSLELVFMSLSSQYKSHCDSFCLNTLFLAESCHITQSEHFLLLYFGTCRKLQDKQQTANDSGSQGTSVIYHLNGGNAWSFHQQNSEGKLDFFLNLYYFIFFSDFKHFILYWSIVD